MSQGQKLMEICVEMWSNSRFDEKPVAIGVNQFFVGPMMFFKTGQLATGPKKPVHK